MTDEINTINGTTPDLESIAKDMLISFRTSLGVHWVQLRPAMEEQIQGVNESILYINKLQLEGELNEESARELIEFQQLNIKMLMVECDGLKDLAIESAINAAFEKVRGAVNRLVNFELL